MSRFIPRSILWRLLLLCWGLASLAALSHWQWAAYLGGITLTVCLVLAVGHISKAAKLLMLGLIAGIGLLLWQTGLPALNTGLLQAIVFAAFIPTARLMRAAAYHDPAIIRIRRNFRRLPQQTRAGWVLYAANALSAVLSIGAFAVMAPLFPRNAPEQKQRLAQIALMGGGLSVLWSPFFVAQAFVAHGYPSLAIWQIVLAGFCISMVGLLIASFINRLNNVGDALAAVIPALGTLLLPLVFAIAAIVLLNRFGGYGNIQAMVLAIPPLALLAAWLRRPSHMHSIFRQAPRWLGGMTEDIGVIVLAILFSAILQQSAFADAAGHWVHQMGLPPMAVLGAAFLLMVGLEVAGLHPILCATLALQITHTVSDRVPDLLAAMVILVAWSFGSVTSYSGLLPSIAAVTFDVAKHRLVYGRNLLYVATGVVLVCGLLAILSLR